MSPTASGLIFAGLVALILLSYSILVAIDRVGPILSRIVELLQERRDDETARESSDSSGVEFTLDTIEQRLQTIEELLGNVSELAGLQLTERLKRNNLAYQRQVRTGVLAYLKERPGQHANVLTMSEVLRLERDDLDRVLSQMAEAGEITFSTKHRTVSLAVPPEQPLDPEQT